MRLTRNVPEAIELYQNGDMSLETMQMVHIYSRKKDLNRAEIQAVVSQVEGLSQKQAEQVIRPEKTYTITLTEEEYSKLRELKARLGTSSMDKILSEALRKISPAVRQPLQISRSRSASKSQKQYLFRQSDRCAHPGCTERDALQIDHIQEWSEGGQTELTNLRLMCPTHNRLHSREKVAPYLRKPQ